MKPSALILTLSLVAGLSLSAAAEPPPRPEGLLPDYTGDLWRRSRLTGDWGGWRTKLAEKASSSTSTTRSTCRGSPTAGSRSAPTTAVTSTTSCTWT